jgi:ribosomal protein S18 acetylase RimI-like enzyme
LTIVRVDSAHFQQLLPLLSWRLTGKEPEEFSADAFKRAVGEHYSIPAHHEDSVEHFLASGYLVIYAAECEHRFVGYVSFFKQPKPNFLLCYYIDELWVAPEFRRRGIATALLTEVAAVARENHAVQTRLYVSGDNDAARALYARSGYTEIGNALFCTHPLD